MDIASRLGMICAFGLPAAAITFLPAHPRAGIKKYIPTGNARTRVDPFKEPVNRIKPEDIDKKLPDKFLTPNRDEKFTNDAANKS